MLYGFTSGHRGGEGAVFLFSVWLYSGASVLLSCHRVFCYIRFPKSNCLPSNGVSMTTSVCGAVDSSAPFHVSFVALSSFLNIPGSSLSLLYCAWLWPQPLWVQFTYWWVWLDSLWFSLEQNSRHRDPSQTNSLLTCRGLLISCRGKQGLDEKGFREHQCPLIQKRHTYQVTFWNNSSGLTKWKLI